MSDNNLSELRKREIEERLERVALEGLCNIYHAITGKECQRFNSLGMATSAVSTLITERDALQDNAEQLIIAAQAALKYVDDLNEDTPADPLCKDCVGVVYFTKGTPEPPLCWIHQLGKAVKLTTGKGEEGNQNDNT